MMKIDKKQYYITLFTIAFVLLFVILFSWWQSDNSAVNGGCSITGINYVDVSPSECWNDDINATFCPLPTNIECQGEVKGLADFMIGIIKQMD